MGYRIRRVDRNQPEIVKALRAKGCKVLILSEMGKGVPDVCVGLPNGKLVLVEIKDGEKPPSQQKLTPDEIAFHHEWQKFVYILSRVEDIDELLNNVSGG